MTTYLVKEARHSHKNLIAGEGYDKITEFENADKARCYYCSVFEKNYHTQLVKVVDGHEQRLAGSCRSALA